ncbi:class I SAM-dependent methyltransferase [Flavobacterium sp. Sr18]|uniref:class I SAM-dependent methyltransferase n=1 Tax=Flavobacterium sp. Sr18 TaxID=935222 RepID=UPI0013E45CFE|nr:class I SAM-dependent methyltransferase [Flavobacterium sp. Sr18]QIH39521.1 class I SAM-dependent methyltransferase [Flavobacterium sp. Sr18]
MKDLEWTGERLTTGVNSVHGVIEHLHRYAIAQEIISNKIVLDIASGEGYGSFLLSRNAKKVYGVDIDEKSINHAKIKYASSKNIEFKVGSTDVIPLEDKSVDVVISFETIEHHNKHDLMLSEISRVLKEDGFLLISSPEKSIYSERDPNNPYHILELTLEDFNDLLKRNFKNVRLFNQRFVIGSLIHPVSKSSKSKFDLFDGDYKHIKNELVNDDFYNKPFFNLALCSNQSNNDCFEVGASLFNGVSVVNNEIKKIIFENDKRYEEVLKSESFRLGNSIVKRINLVRKFWKK